MKVRYAKYSNPTRGGRMIEERILNRLTTVVFPDGVTYETRREAWLDIGTLMDPIENHVKEQPTCYAQKLLQAHIERTT